jgi:aminoglycoside 6'-N-acetyltransferase
MRVALQERENRWTVDNSRMSSMAERRPLPTLEGTRVVLRPGLTGDEAAMAAMFATDDVARWWPIPDADEIESLVHNRDPDVDVWMIETDGRVVGLIQGYEESDPMYRHAGIDIVMHPDAHGRGLGPEAIRVLARHLFHHRGHHRLVIDPNAANARAIHVYQKVGFQRVGVLRQYEWSAREGRWTDGLLLDLLREDLTPD